MTVLHEIVICKIVLHVYRSYISEKFLPSTIQAAYLFQFGTHTTIPSIIWKIVIDAHVNDMHMMLLLQVFVELRNI